MKLSGALTLVAAAVSAASATTAVVSSFCRGGRTFTIATEKRPGPAESHGTTLTYSVTASDRDLHRGQLVSEADVRAYAIETFPAEAPLGWLLLASLDRGNTSQLRARLISVASVGSSSACRELTFDCKSPPVLRNTDRGCELWACYQDWGKGGTSSSIFIPFRVRVSADGDIARVPLPDDPRAWPKIDFVGSFPGVFVAGLRERNAALMTYALERLYSSDDQEWYAAYGLPERKTLEEIALLARSPADGSSRLDGILHELGTLR